MLDSMEGVWHHDRLKVREWKGEAVRYVQPKRDGWHIACFMQVDPANGLCAFGRKREAHLEYSHFFEGLDWYERLKSMPPASSVEGELWVPGQPASYVRSAMSLNPRELVYTPFAIPSWKGEPITSMTQAQHICRAQLGLQFVDTFEYQGESREELIKAARFFDAEGMVLKVGHREGWYKVKEVHTCDLVCTAVKPGKADGKYIGECGSVEGSIHRDGKLVALGWFSGMDDDDRAAISQADVGRVFEVAYQYVGAGGRFRHPRFIRWRDDKPAGECTWEQLSSLPAE